MNRVRLKGRVYLLPAVIIALSAAISSVPSVYLHAATEVLKTSRVRVGDKAPLAGEIEKAHKAGKAIVLLLLSNPMQCRRCDEVDAIIREGVSRYPGAAYVAKGGQDMLGAADAETVMLKRLFGFVTMGEPWTFVIDREGVLKRIFIGGFTGDELGAALRDAGAQ